MRSGLDRLRDLNRVVLLDNVLDRDDGVGLVRHDRPGRDGHGTAGLDRASNGCPAADSPTTRSVPGSIGRAHGEAVHRRARERRQVDPGTDVLRADASARLGDRHDLRRKRPGELQHPLLRLLEGE